MIPIVAGLLMGAAMGGGIAALQKKNVLEGALMGAAGGALGGVLMPGAGAAGAIGGETVGTAASSGLAPVATEGVATSLANPGNLFAGGSLNSGVANLGLKTAGSQALMPSAMGVPVDSIAGSGLTVPTSMANATSGAGTGLFGGAGGIGNFLSQNKGALMGGGLGGMLARTNEPEEKSEGNIYDMTFSQDRNPLFGQPGQEAFTNQRYATNSITPVEDYKPSMNAANGGIIALAEGGQPGIEMQRYDRPMRQVAPEVAAYNAKLMERANQQYNINLPPAPNQVPGSAGYISPPVKKAPAATTGTTSSNSISGITFNPVTQQYEGDYSAPGNKKEEVEKESGYRPYESWASGSGGNDSSSNADNAGTEGESSGEAAGEKNGGLINRRYNMGGISSLGTYSDGGQLLRGPGDGVSDDIPAQIGARQPARLADGEFVVPARVVSELGNGSTDAGAKRLYAMMDRVQKNRRKSVGKGKVAVDSKAYKHLPA